MMKVLFAVAILLILLVIFWCHLNIVGWVIKDGEVLLRYYLDMSYSKLIPCLTYNEATKLLMVLIGIVLPSFIIYIRSQEPEQSTLDEHLTHAPKKGCKRNN